jgi:3-deoxy-7-phosphoheptulonate synthase
MVVVMSPRASNAEIDAVAKRVREAGGQAFVSRGLRRTIVGLVGDVHLFRTLNLRAMAGVADVIIVSTPYKLVSLENHLGRSTVEVGTAARGGRIGIGPGTVTLIAGPSTVESLGQTLEIAELAKAAGAQLLQGGAFRPRIAPDDFEGLGETALSILAEVRAATGMPVVTEVADVAHVPLVAEYADMLQIGARNMTNHPLLEAAGKAGLPVLLRRGVQATIQEWLMAAEYVAQRGNLDIVLCERGIRTFETATPSTLDLSSVPVVQGLSHLPVIVDPSHAAGRRDLVLPLARAALAAGADGLMIDMNPDPEAALDGAQALAGSEARELASMLRRLPPLVGRVRR